CSADTLDLHSFPTRRSSDLTSSTPGTWNGTPNFTYDYQWQLCDSGGAACQDLTGQTNPTYTPASTDPGHTLRLKVTAHNPSSSTDRKSTRLNSSHSQISYAV